jgi:ribosome-associated translation inhibitor RaiA
MDLQIDFVLRDGPGDMADAARDYARRRLSFAVRRFRHRLERVTIRLLDLNGPKRGLDSRCTITADLADGRQLFVAATDAWPFAAITHAAARLNEALRRDGSRQARRAHTTPRKWAHVTA